MTGTIYDFCEAFHISIGKARKMEKGGWLRLAGSNDTTDPMRASLANGDRLTALQLVELIEQPAGLLELGKYAGRAEREIAALGNPQAAPSTAIPASVPGATFHGSFSAMCTDSRMTMTANGGMQITVTPTAAAVPVVMSVGATVNIRPGQLTGTYVGSNRVFANYQ